MNLKYDLLVIGGGPAGMAAALAAKENGVKDILILERDKYLGGILPQCIHNGFGLEYFKEELTGPEYALRFQEKIKKTDIDVKTDTMVIKITKEKEITALNEEDGVLKVKAKAIVLAMGCRERTRENIKIPGARLAGVFSAGTAQRYTNVEGYMPGKRVIILGSGDIGLIMARRMKLEGAQVLAVLEILPYSTGLTRNKVQCLDDFNIPLKLNHTITCIEGKDRVERVNIAKVDENLNIIAGSEEKLECDTVLLSVGLIPENELSKKVGVKLDPVTKGAIVNEIRETNIKGIFAAGNVLHVHDLVDWVTKEAELAGQGVGNYLTGQLQKRKQTIRLIPAEDVSYLVPQKIEYINNNNYTKIYLRVKKPRENVIIHIINADNNQTLLSYKKEIVSPGEMISINLPEKILNDKIKNINISISKKGL